MDCLPWGSYQVRLLVVVLGSLDSSVNNLEKIGGHEIPLSQHAHTSTISFEQFSMLNQLLQLELRQLHEAIDFVFGPIVVLDAESIDSYDLDAALVADF